MKKELGSAKSRIFSKLMKLLRRKRKKPNLMRIISKNTLKKLKKSQRGGKKLRPLNKA
jgi:hypothetical protein